MHNKQVKLDNARLLGCRLLDKEALLQDAGGRQRIGAKVGDNGKVEQKLPSSV